MTPQEKAAETVRRTNALMQVPYWPSTRVDHQEAQNLASKLTDSREFQLLAELCERITRMQPNVIHVRKLHVQALIEIGQASAAISVAQQALKGLPSRHKEWSELHGMTGRAYKQIAIDIGEPRSRESKNALAHALDGYRKPYSLNKRNTWHAINLVAVMAYAKRSGISVPRSLDIKPLANQIIARVSCKPEATRDRWDAATLAEAYLALGDWNAVEKNLYAYLSNPELKAFEAGSTLRQFSEVWGLRNATDSRSKGILQALRARLMELPRTRIRLSPKDVTLQSNMTPPSPEQLQAILGKNGTRSYEWWKWGLDRACSVVAIYSEAGQRIGTGFAVKAKDLKLADTEELLIMTNFHVINEKGIGGAVRPADGEIAFEALDASTRYPIKAIVWSSPVERHDATILRLAELPAQLKAIPLAQNLPTVSDTAKVYIIGHPGGGGLEFSFQDNDLLDHEAVEGGQPGTPEVCRLHYHAPTEKGSSGSPVFNASSWKGIALHHAGGVLSKLNGQQGTYQANEGISLLSIAEAIGNKKTYLP